MTGAHYEYEVVIHSNEDIDSILWIINTNTSEFFAVNETTIKIPNSNSPFLDCFVRAVDVRGNESFVRVAHLWDEDLLAPYFDYKITPFGVWAVLSNAPSSHIIFAMDSLVNGVDSVYLPLDKSMPVELNMFDFGASGSVVSNFWYYDKQQPTIIDAVQIQLKGKPVSNQQYSVSPWIQQMRMKYVDDQGQEWEASDQQPSGSYISIKEADIFELNENGQQTVVAQLDFRFELTLSAIPGSAKRLFEGSAVVAIPVEE